VKQGVVLLGASGHAKVVIELFRAMGEQVDFCVGDEASAATCLGVPVLKGDAHLERLLERGYSRAFVAIGSNALRARLGEAVQRLGYELVSAISPQALVSPTARIGNGVAIMAGAVINAEAVIGDLAIVNTGATIDHDCQIGVAVHIAPQCGLAGNVTVGAGSFLGIGCKVIPRVSIGAGVTVGAGGVVVNPLPDGTLAVGVPARPVKRTDRG
jgi:UDP-perosamine 4-acetyltransferase